MSSAVQAHRRATLPSVPVPPPTVVDPPCGPPVAALLASERRRSGLDLRSVPVDGRARGAVAARARQGTVRRAEPGPCGPLVLEARAEPGSVVLEVWGPASTPAPAAADALAAAAGWAGLDDDADGFGELVATHPTLRALHRRLGTPALSRLPRVEEAVGRAVLGQLVQSVEAVRSTAQVAALAGEPAPGGLWCWPTAARLGTTPAWELRRCGVSLRGARALHAAAVAERRLIEARHDWALLDRRLRTLPGVGVWTSGEARLALGDPDAVAVGDYHLPSIVGHALAGASGDGPDGSWTDAGMLALLAPFTGQRGRVIRLVLAGMTAGLVRRPARRAPRAALSRHRYW